MKYFLSALSFLIVPTCVSAAIEAKAAEVKCTGTWAAHAGQLRANVLMQLGVNADAKLTEMLWSPTGRFVSVTASDGGIVGTWSVNVFALDRDGGLHKHDNLRDAFKSADAFPDCDEKETPNIGAIAWLNNGRDILLVAEVPPHSSCRNMSALSGYLVQVESGKIIEQLSESQLREKWGPKLGCRFARDDQ